MSPEPTPVAQYLNSLPEDRREALEAIRKVVNKNRDKKFEEGIQYKMLAWYLPHSEYPAGYHCDPKQPLPFASVASQKNHIGLYLFCIYCSEDDKQQFVDEWKASGKKLDMGKSCVRVKKLEDIPMDVLGRAFKRATAKRFVAAYEGSFVNTPAKKASKKAAKKTAKKAVGKQKASKRATSTRRKG